MTTQGPRILQRERATSGKQGGGGGALGLRLSSYKAGPLTRVCVVLVTNESEPAHIVGITKDSRKNFRRPSCALLPRLCPQKRRVLTDVPKCEWGHKCLQLIPLHLLYADRL